MADCCCCCYCCCCRHRDAATVAVGLTWCKMGASSVLALAMPPPASIHRMYVAPLDRPLACHSHDSHHDSHHRSHRSHHSHGSAAVGGWPVATAAVAGWLRRSVAAGGCCTGAGLLHLRRAAAAGAGRPAGVGAAAASVRHAGGGLAVVPGARCGGLQGCSCGPSGRVGGHDKTFSRDSMQVFFFISD